MIHRGFSIYDHGVNTFSTPFFVTHVTIALRYFEALAKDEKSDVSKYPRSFQLYEVGEFDDSNGSFTPHTTPVSVGFASQFLPEVTANAS